MRIQKRSFLISSNLPLSDVLGSRAGFETCLLFQIDRCALMVGKSPVTF
jgi:hypothetical protein